MSDKFDKVNAEILAKLDGQERADFERGLRNIGMDNPADKAALRAAFKRFRPDATDQELDIMVSGKAPKPDKPEWS